jgi:hypothetical protein
MRKNIATTKISRNVKVARPLYMIDNHTVKAYAECKNRSVLKVLALDADD